MLKQLELSRVAVILVRARNPNNIGAVARAMHDFGFSDLRIVNDYPMPLEGARSAVDASAIIHSASTYETVARAIADCSLVIGTTAVGERELAHPLLSLREANSMIHTAVASSGEGKVAILFGSEKTGLSNDELSHCNLLLTIPMFQHPESRHPSMNLGQAVAVCLYELVRGSQAEMPHPSTPMVSDAAPAAELERFTNLFSEVLEATGYVRHHPANSTLSHLRRLVLRLHLSRADVAVWMGIFRQTLWKLRN